MRNKKRRREQVKSAKALDLLRAAGAATTSKKKRPTRKKNEVLCVGAERLRVERRSKEAGDDIFLFFKQKIVGAKRTLLRRGGLYRARTCDPIDVNDVLYQLS